VNNVICYFLDMGKRKLKQPKLILKENEKIIVNYNNLYAHTATDPQLRRMRKGKYNLPDSKSNFYFCPIVSYCGIVLV